MKILFVTPYVPSRIRVRPFNFIRELSRRHSVTLLAMGAVSNGEDLQSLRAHCGEVDVVPLNRAAGLAACVTGALRGRPIQSEICRSPLLEIHVRERCASEKFDVAHVEHLRAAHLADNLPEGLPVVFDSVDCITLLHERTIRSSHSFRRRLLARVELARTRKYERQCTKRFDRVLVTSDDDRDALQALGALARIDVVPNGVDLDYFTPIEGPRDPATIVFSGKMSYHANVTAVLHFVRAILPRVRASHPDVRFKIIGSNPPREVRDLAGDPRIEVTGHVPDLRAAIGRATVAVCPVTVKVGIQNKILEAMALGIPVVASDLGARGLQTLPERDLLVADDVESFAAHLGRVLDQSGLRDSLAAAGRRYVELHHRWSSAVSRLEDAYVEAIERYGDEAASTASPGPRLTEKA